MEALKVIKIIGNQNAGMDVFLFLPNTGYVTKGLNFMRDPKLAHILVKVMGKPVAEQECWEGGGDQGDSYAESE